MFTGLVEALADVCSAEPDGAGGTNLGLRMPFARELVLGESVAVNGCCLTVVATGDAVRFQVGPETLARTNLGALRTGDRVNVERSLRFGDRLGGHLVTGHVDGVGRIDAREPSGDWQTVWFSAPEALTAAMVPKGSVAVDGVSLTVVEVRAGRFSVMLIPHTLAVTTLGSSPTGSPVNLETDLIGKYVAQWMTAYR
jgi:riboflavin synthase